MIEQEKVEKMNGLREAADNLVKLFEMQADGMRQMSEVLENRRVALDERVKDLDEREVKIERREANVDQYRQLAADRKAQLDVAKDAVDKADKMRRNAEAEMRRAKQGKQDLETVLTKLLQEKNELAAQLASLQTARPVPAEEAV